MEKSDLKNKNKTRKNRHTEKKYIWYVCFFFFEKRKEGINEKNNLIEQRKSTVDSVHIHLKQTRYIDFLLLTIVVKEVFWK